MREPYPQPTPQPEALIATFGQARLVKLPDRTYELLGGSEADRAAAIEWISLFMKNDVVRDFPPRQRQKPDTAD